MCTARIVISNNIQFFLICKIYLLWSEQLKNDNLSIALHFFSEYIVNKQLL